MEKYFDSFSKKVLQRKQDGFFTLQDEATDRTWGLLNTEDSVFTPDKQTVETFASISYILGVLGYEVQMFTAVPAGYIATYNKNGQTFTILSSVENSADVRKQFVSKIQEVLQDKKLSEEEQSFLHYLASLLDDKRVPLLDIVALANEEIKTKSTLKAFHENAQKAMYPFSGDAQSLNSQNCDKNHEILYKICADTLGLAYPPQTEADEHKILALGTSILQDWILPGYFTYVGHNRQGDAVPQNGIVLNNVERIQELVSMLKKENATGVVTAKQIAPIINMCAMDYTADIVYKVLQEIDKSKTYERCKARVQEVIPATVDNYWTKKEANVA